MTAATETLAVSRTLDQENPPRWMMPALVSIGALLLAAFVTIIVLLAVLSGTSSTTAAEAPKPDTAPVVASTPEPTETPEPEATPEPEEEPAAAPPAPAPAPAPPAPAPAPPADPKPVFTTFSPKNGTDVNCADEYDSKDVYFNWTTHHADQAWIGISTQNAQQAPYAAVPVSGSYKITFQCSHESEIYTVTAVGAYGTSHFTVRLYR